MYEGFSWQLIHVGGYVVLVGQIRPAEADGDKYISVDHFVSTCYILGIMLISEEIKVH